MPTIGFQDLWVSGSRLYFQRNPKDGEFFPLLDLGVVDPINPSAEIEKLEQKDSECGVEVLVDERVARISESYQVTCKNFNPDNLALLFRDESPEAYVTAPDDSAVGEGDAFQGHLLKIEDNVGESVWDITEVYGIYTQTDVVDWPVIDMEVDEIEAPSNINLVGDHTDKGLYAGQEIILSKTNLTDEDAAGKYTLTVDAQYNAIADRTVIQVTPDISQYAQGPGMAGKVVHGHDVTWDVTNWELVDLTKALIRVTGALSGRVNIGYAIPSKSGLRLIRPQSLQGEVEGQMMVVWCRGNMEQESCRLAEAILSPSGVNITVEEFSTFTVDLRIVETEDEAQPVGSLIYYEGDLTDIS